jgi:hypothetical protein
MNNFIKCLVICVVFFILGSAFGKSQNYPSEMNGYQARDYNDPVWRAAIWWNPEGGPTVGVCSAQSRYDYAASLIIDLKTGEGMLALRDAKGEVSLTAEQLRQLLKLIPVEKKNG